MSAVWAMSSASARSPVSMYAERTNRSENVRTNSSNATASLPEIPLQSAGQLRSPLPVHHSTDQPPPEHAALRHRASWTALEREGWSPHSAGPATRSGGVGQGRLRTTPPWGPFGARSAAGLLGRAQLLPGEVALCVELDLAAVQGAVVVAAFGGRQCVDDGLVRVLSGPGEVSQLG